MPKARSVEAKYVQIGDILVVEPDEEQAKTVLEQTRTVQEISYNPKKELVKVWYRNYIGFDLVGSTARFKKVGKE